MIIFLNKEKWGTWNVDLLPWDINLEKLVYRAGEIYDNVLWKYVNILSSHKII
jgi:hypothetical protein